MSSAFEGLPKTPNLRLNKPGYDNVADIEALNENADILDEEIQGIKNTFVKSVNGINAGDDGNVDLGIIPISQGGTGQTTASGIRNALGLGNTTGAVPIANGGTGATTAKQACANIGAVRSVNGVNADDSGNVQINTMPVGMVIPFAGNNIPSGYLACNGSAISRTTYTDLFAVIGTTYGAGDGSTTFNLPNLNNSSFLEGSNTAGTVKSAGLPNATGTFKAMTSANSVDGGPFWGKLTEEGALYRADACGTLWYYGSDSSSTAGTRGIKMDLSRSNSIYGNSDTVQPKSVTVRYCIKY